jgi:hypothetical protein
VKSEMFKTFLLENLKEKCFFGDLGVDGKMKLKWMVRTDVILGRAQWQVA